MIEPQYKAYPHNRPVTSYEHLMNQVEDGRTRIGADAAREIAQRIEEQHGFWDLAERKAAA